MSQESEEGGIKERTKLSVTTITYWVTLADPSGIVYNGHRSVGRLFRIPVGFQSKKKKPY